MSSHKDLSEELLPSVEKLASLFIAMGEEMESIRIFHNGRAYERVRKVLLKAMNSDIPDLISTLDALFPEKVLRVPAISLDKASEAILAKHQKKLLKMKKKKKNPSFIHKDLLASGVKDKRRKPISNMDDIFKV